MKPSPFKKKERKMKPSSSIFIIIKLLIIQYLSVSCLSQDFDFFYFILQWPGAECITKRGCCYPEKRKPASDFIIHGLWPVSLLSSILSNCQPNNVLSKSQISGMINDLQKNWPSLSCPNANSFNIWSIEWKKYGTCATNKQVSYNQHSYFETALKLRKKINLLQILKNEGIHPNGETYEFDKTQDAIIRATGHLPGIYCNVDKYGNRQLNAVYLCAEPSASQLSECPGLPQTIGGCGSKFRFPKF